MAHEKKHPSAPLLPLGGPSLVRQPRPGAAQAVGRQLRAYTLLLLALYATLWLKELVETSSPPAIPACATSLAPFDHTEYSARRTHLSSSLAHANLSAYVSEPSPNTLYYYNISSSSWHLSERPFLLVTLPGEESATLIVVPSFEETRAKLQLPLALDKDESKTIWLPWGEAEDPYAQIFQHVGLDDGEGAIRVAVDENVRSGIAADLQASLARQAAGRPVEVLSSPKEIKSLRERKSEVEIKRLKCANELTLWAIRQTKKDLYFGISEGEASSILDKHFKQVGFGKAGALVLFGQDAALPHGASGDHRLAKDELVLIDAGGVFQGYTADITRTFALKGSKISKRHLDIWSLVHAAQKAAYDSISLNSTGGSTDRAARSLLSDAGFGPHFTHRLGHGIGLEGHESPYLHSGNDVPLQSGNSFSNEPGVYIEGEVGVRLEDCWVLTEDGKARAFTPQQESVWVI